ncbi:MAG: GNAT family N-acetyltransferase [Cyanobacteria bacterium P01_G01_bin.67]
MNIKQDSCIRPIKPDDLPALKTVIDANELFPSDLLDEMISDYFSNEDSHDYWFTYDEDQPIAIAYCAPEKMTEGTWNLYLIAVHPDYQGSGRGTSMLHHIEQRLSSRGERILLVETSGLDSFNRTRAFYSKCGYEQEAQIREFYQAGEDKIIFRKSLTDLK